MKEAYVSFETAKLLKEKGFDWKCSAWYAKYDTGVELHTDIERRDYNSDTVSLYDGLISAPTLQMACRWLREEHKIHISIIPCEVGAGVMDYTSCLYKIKDENWFESMGIQGRATYVDVPDYEMCVEAALKYVLTELI